ncbi:hypothetical protein EIN_161400 [Entamoeba invadens IP1]|uniref:Uncharacterized protein n=1 Tax=Entamoeba invadens IP1 TaxID=370355 RepID=A0A0A1TYF0_ENTIV|nr:hypothetical protein EIN_161400 [Entamoeba invadens IP1]ELP86546.1 hypothetical protein EIN_161400 [Entamoeba invadens IP1]|eukprot:XP_004185892.1 hypothetical protein EIN_161400 [Entamoeba invadens IP1]
MMYIGELAFHSSGITSVTTPKTITLLGTQIFDSCLKLTSVDLNGLTQLTTKIFSGCTALKTISGFDGVETIDAAALTGITIPSIHLYPSLVTLNDDLSSFTNIFFHGDAQPKTVTTSLNTGLKIYVKESFTGTFGIVDVMKARCDSSHAIVLEIITDEIVNGDDCRPCETGSNSGDGVTDICEQNSGGDTPTTCSVANCQTCDIDFTTLCDTCNGTNKLSVDKTTCSANCSSGEYEMNSTTCVACSVSMCATCTKETAATKCDSCKNSLKLSSDKTACGTTCPNGEIDNNGICSKCSVKNCITCTTDPTTKCDSCNTGYNLYYNKTKCGTKCPDGEYSGTTNICNKCTVSNCKTCDTNNTKCDTCIDNNKLSADKTKCSTSCAAGEYENGNNMCTTCGVANCGSCTSSEPNKCISCTGTNKLSVDKTKCSSTCPSGQTFINNNTCISCSVSLCSVCDADSTKCEKCSATNVVQIDQLACIEKCPNGEYAKGNNKQCTKCTTMNCATCDTYDTYDVCTSCTSPYVLNTTTKLCNPPQSDCGDGKFGMTPNCENCGVENCKMCVDKTSCNKCLNGFDIYFENKCLQKCPSGYFKSQTICEKCKETYDTPCTDKECRICTIDNNKDAAVQVAIEVVMFMLFIIMI